MAASPPNVEKSVRVAKLLFVGSPLEPSSKVESIFTCLKGRKVAPPASKSSNFRPPFSCLFCLCPKIESLHCVDLLQIWPFHHFLADSKGVLSRFQTWKFHSSSVGFVKGIQDGRHGVVAAQSKSGALSLNERPREKDLQKGARSSGF